MSILENIASILGNFETVVVGEKTIMSILFGGLGIV